MSLPFTRRQRTAAAAAPTEATAQGDAPGWDPSEGEPEFEPGQYAPDRTPRRTRTDPW